MKNILKMLRRPCAETRYGVWQNPYWTRSMFDCADVKYVFSPLSGIITFFPTNCSVPSDRRAEYGHYTLNTHRLNTGIDVEIEI